MDSDADAVRRLFRLPEIRQVTSPDSQEAKPHRVRHCRTREIRPVPISTRYRDRLFAWQLPWLGHCSVRWCFTRFKLS